MCGISGVELLVILVAAIVILGPDKLPELLRTAGKLARDLRRLRGQLSDVTQEFKNQVNVDNFEESLGVRRVRERIRDAESEIDAIRSQISQSVESAGKTGSPGAGVSDSPTEPELPVLRPAAGAEARGGGSPEAPQATPEPQAPAASAPAANPEPTPVPRPATPSVTVSATRLRTGQDGSPQPVAETDSDRGGEA